MLKQQDRFVNNELLGFISRPQYESSCSMSSLTAVINYLFSDQIGIKTTRQWAEDIKIHPPTAEMSPGNETVLKWFKKVCEHYGVEGKCDYFISDEDVEDWSKNPELINRLKKAITNKEQALIYHMANHYNVIVGYFENSKESDEAYNPDAELQRWIIIGDHSDHNPIPKVIQKDMKALPEKVLSEDYYNLIMERAATPPVWCRRWGSIRHDLINTSNHCILVFEK